MLPVFIFVFLVIFCAKMNFQDLPDVFPLRLCVSLREKHNFQMSL